jgi:uncharacterized protein (TIGR02757 family)
LIPSAQVFIAGDPIQFPHRFREQPRDAELVAWLAALFSYGQRQVFIPLLERMLRPLGPQPCEFLMNARLSELQRVVPDFRYRFNTHHDYLAVLITLQSIYQTHTSLERLMQSVHQPKTQTYAQQLQAFMNAVSPATETLPPGHGSNGLRFLLPWPKRGGSCKRLHMFLRWVVRPPDDGVDLGLWRHALKPSQLLIPLDVHVAKAARALGYTQRNANDWKTVEAITAALRQRDPNDPVRFDRELFEWGQTLK